MTSACRHRGQIRAIHDQRMRSAGLSRGRFTERWYTASWCRRARTSSCMEARDRTLVLMNAMSARRMGLISRGLLPPSLGGEEATTTGNRAGSGGNRSPRDWSMAEPGRRMLIGELRWSFREGQATALQSRWETSDLFVTPARCSRGVRVRPRSGGIAWAGCGGGARAVNHGAFAARAHPESRKASTRRASPGGSFSLPGL